MRRKQLGSILSSIALLATLITVPTAELKASPENDVLTTYYDCALNEVGWKFRGCDGLTGQGGQLYGAFRMIEEMQCGGTYEVITYYAWDGTRWVYLDGPPEPTC